MPNILLDCNIPAHADQLLKLRNAVRNALRDRKLPEMEVDQIVLAIDEACSNVIKHGYGAMQTDGEIRVQLSLQNNTLYCRVYDSACSIDANRCQPRKLNELKPHGLGTHFIRSVMNQVEYKRLSDEQGNVLVMSKHIK